MNIMPASLPDVRRPEVGVKVASEIIRTRDGRVIQRTRFDNGNVVETLVSPLDYEPVPGAKPNRIGELLMQPRTRT